MVTLSEPPILNETFESTTPKKIRFRYGAIRETIKALPILRCLHGSEMVVLGLVIGMCDTPSTIF